MTNISIVGIDRLVNGDLFLRRKGRYVNCVLMVESGGARYRLTIRGGKIESVETGRLIMARYDLLMRASADTWNRFWEPAPAPGYNDSTYRRWRASTNRSAP